MSRAVTFSEMLNEYLPVRLIQDALLQDNIFWNRLECLSAFVQVYSQEESDLIGVFLHE